MFIHARLYVFSVDLHDPTPGVTFTVEITILCGPAGKASAALIAALQQAPSAFKFTPCVFSFTRFVVRCSVHMSCTLLGRVVTHAVD